jgi:NAD(P)-dependent dehydrogenase (short-subunit alcohol dehydrogenase family)
MATSSSPSKTVLLIGASRGLGYALAEEFLKRGWRVVATIRAGVRAKLQDLVEGSDGRLEIETLDITEPHQIDALRTRLAKQRFDLLFVNAGTKNPDGETVADVATDEFERVMVTNALAPMRVIEKMRDLLTPSGVIGVMSSGLGSVTNNDRGGYEVYRASKAALNTLMRSFAARTQGEGRRLFVMAPGWVRTDMGGPDAPLGIEDSIPKLTDVLTAPGEAGLQYLDYLGRTVPW